MAILIDDKDLTTAIRSTLVGQLAVYGVSFPEHVITAMTDNIAQSVVGLEVDGAEPDAICNECGDPHDGIVDHTACLAKEEAAKYETEEDRLGLRSMWSVLVVLLALAFAACGDNRPAPPRDALPVRQPACLTAPLEPVSCTTTLHHELCVNTIVLGSYRGCCQVGPDGLDFFPCE